MFYSIDYSVDTVEDLMLSVKPFKNKFLVALRHQTCSITISPSIGIREDDLKMY